MNDPISKLFFEVRTNARISQKEMAVILGISQGSISKIESADLLPTLDVWFKFKEYFNITEDPPSGVFREKN